MLNQIPIKHIQVCVRRTFGIKSLKVFQFRCLNSLRNKERLIIWMSAVESAAGLINLDSPLDSVAPCLSVCLVFAEFPSQLRCLTPLQGAQLTFQRPLGRICLNKWMPPSARANAANPRQECGKRTEASVQKHGGRHFAGRDLFWFLTHAPVTVQQSYSCCCYCQELRFSTHNTGHQQNKPVLLRLHLNTPEPTQVLLHHFGLGAFLFQEKWIIIYGRLEPIK